MPISARWRPLATLPAKRGRDAMPGVYELADENKHIVYIGQSAKDVPNRIRQHLEKSSCVSELAHYWRYVYSRVPQADEATHIARFIEKHADLPICNSAKPRLRTSLKRYSERSRKR